MTLLSWRMPARSAAVLEVATLPDAHRTDRLVEAKERLGADGVWYLGTCQRVMWVLHGGTDPATGLQRLYQGWSRQVPAPEVLHGFQAFRHLCEVASSLDAFVPGEPQVLGQVRQAVREETGLLDTDLRHVLDHVLRTAKEVRSQTDLFRGKVSLVPLAQQVISEALQDHPAPAVSVLGTGEMAVKCIEAVRATCPEASVEVVSRDLERGRRLAHRIDGTAASMADFCAEPPAARLVVCAMGADGAVLDGQWLQRAATPLTVVDLGMPRNVEAAPVPGVHLVQMDDLGRMAGEARSARDGAVAEAERILDEAVARVRKAYDERCHASTLHQLTSRFETVMEERWRDHPGQDPRTRKWVEQTVRALLHEAATVVKEPEA